MILTVELSDLKLEFNVLNTELADLWAERMSQRNKYPLDDSKRFYGFNSLETEQQLALEKLNLSVQAVNAWRPIIDRTLDSVYNQDTLNYLHSVFEQWHGLLDQSPSHPEYGTIPTDIREHLSDINVGVHRCESVARGNRPRFVCTWYGMPKTRTLTDSVITAHGQLNPPFGTACLNYTEIGKTLEDLAIDNDTYISKDAFRPFNHYSADFNVCFYQITAQEVDGKLQDMKNYYDKHREFFVQQGYKSFEHPRLQPLRLPVAELVETMPRDKLIEQIAMRQKITSVTLQ